MNQLDQLRQYTTVVADTADFELMRAYQPQEATTNPSLILKAVQKDAYQPLFKAIVERYRSSPLSEILDQVLVGFGKEILNNVPGRVSTEVDARLSFDTTATISRAHHLIHQYQAMGIPRERVLIKIAATWEGIRAAKILQHEKIHCNMTLVFSLIQAAACAEAGAQLISPFVGRIYDWYKKAAGPQWEESAYTAARDPGVQSVCGIYAYFKKHRYKTQIMGASFRSKEQILALSGCDLLTISPELLKQLQQSDEKIARQLDYPAMDGAQEQYETKRLPADEASFRYLLNENQAASEKLAEGIRLFAEDTRQLERLIKEIVEA